MNKENEISKKTTLYGFIGEDAGVSVVSATTNKQFKASAIDAMMIPLNIRSDDFYFTLVNMKKSHVNGALISKEYTTVVLETLDSYSDAVRKSQMCDFVVRKDEKLYGDIVVMPALVAYLKEQGANKIALLGTSAAAKAFTLFASSLELSFFSDNLEELMEFCSSLEIKSADINRIAEGMQVDLSRWDAVVDFADLAKFANLLPAMCVDLKLKKESSFLRETIPSGYVGFEELVGSIAEKIASLA